MNKPLLFLITAAYALTAGLAEAKDSKFLLGDNGKIAVTTFEHREGAASRATEIKLIFGQHFLGGRLIDADSGTVTLKEKGASGSSYTFSGSFKVDYDKLQMTLKGKLKTPPDTGSTSLNTTFKCKELNP